VKFSLVELEELTGEKIKVYSIIIEEEELTIYDKFLDENQDQFQEEVIDITNRIEVIAKYIGLRDDFIKQGEGELGDGIHAFYDKPESKLRLYFIRFGNVAIVLGGGGNKPKTIRRFQDDPKLKDENYFLRKVSVILAEAVREGTLFITDQGLESTTDFIYTNDEDE
jgi:hypothetical protein